MTPLHYAAPEQVRVLMVGGTSAGHVAPLVAVAEALEQLEPGIHLSFVCSDRAIDTTFLRVEQRPFSTLPLSRHAIARPFTFLQAFLRSFIILNRDQPDVVFSKGSAVSVPLCYAAWMKRIPVVLHESDTVMGRANNMISHIATKTLSGTEIGNPIRTRMIQGKKEEGLRITGLDDRKPIVLIIGGSQGARSINEKIVKHLETLLQVCHIIHVTGTGKNMTQNKPGYFASEFPTDVLPHLYACTDLAVGRAGAGSIAEFAACGIPAILIPIKGLAGDHQVKNAELAEKTGATITLPQEKLDELPSLITSLLNDAGRLQTMRDRCRYAAKPEAARLIAETIVQSVAKKTTRA